MHLAILHLCDTGQCLADIGSVAVLLFELFISCNDLPQFICNYLSEKGNWAFCLSTFLRWQKSGNASKPYKITAGFFFLKQPQYHAVYRTIILFNVTIFILEQNTLRVIFYFNFLQVDHLVQLIWLVVCPAFRMSMKCIIGLGWGSPGMKLIFSVCIPPTHHPLPK